MLSFSYYIREARYLEGNPGSGFSINQKTIFDGKARPGILQNPYSFFVSWEVNVAKKAAKRKKTAKALPATELFPDLKDPKKTPGIALRGVRLRMELTQKQMAEKIGVVKVTLLAVLHLWCYNHR